MASQGLFPGQQNEDNSGFPTVCLSGPKCVQHVPRALHRLKPASSFHWGLIALCSPFPAFFRVGFFIQQVVQGKCLLLTAIFKKITLFLSCCLELRTFQMLKYWQTFWNPSASTKIRIETAPNGMLAQGFGLSVILDFDNILTSQKFNICPFSQSIATEQKTGQVQTKPSNEAMVHIHWSISYCNWMLN